MSEAEYLSEQGEADYFVSQMSKEEREKNIAETKKRLMKMLDTELLDYICQFGKKLNTCKRFKAYDVAKRIKDNKWIPTVKQRESLINTVAIALNTD